MTIKTLDKQVKEVSAKLKKAVDLQNKHAQQALFAVVNEAVAQIKEVVPYDLGHLEGSIHIVEKHPAPTVHIKAGASYAAKQEFNENYRHKEGRKAHYMQHGVNWFNDNGLRLVGNIVKGAFGK